AVSYRTERRARQTTRGRDARSSIDSRGSWNRTSHELRVRGTAGMGLRVRCIAAAGRGSGNASFYPERNGIMNRFEMDPDWLCFLQNPTEPAFRLPPQSTDAHCHVFGPAAAFPYAA